MSGASAAFLPFRDGLDAVADAARPPLCSQGIRARYGLIAAPTSAVSRWYSRDAGISDIEAQTSPRGANALFIMRGSSPRRWSGVPALQALHRRGRERRLVLLATRPGALPCCYGDQPAVRAMDCINGRGVAIRVPSVSQGWRRLALFRSYVNPDRGHEIFGALHRPGKASRSRGAVRDWHRDRSAADQQRADVIRVGDVILGFNVVLFLAAIALLGVNAALYSILTYLAAAKTLDFVLHGIDEYTAVTIVSEAHAAIRERLTRDLARGVTVYRGYGGLSGAERDILYCVVTRLEISRLKSLVREIDENAFIVYHALAGAEGGVVKTRGFH